MIHFFADYGVFLLKVITLVIATLVLFAGIFSMGKKSKPKIEMTLLNDEHENIKKMLAKTLGNKLTKKKKEKKSPPNLFVLDFNGDIKASQTEGLREEINALLSVVQPHDEVLVRLDSPGGAVNGYGLAAAELQRLKDRNIPLTICIDKMAASGGYLMACIADNIIAAPFAIIGSIGVVAQMPNFHRWLKERQIDVELLTAGEYKRTLTMFGENTDKGRQKFKEDLEQIHTAFRNYVLQFRNELDIDAVATGEHWLAVDAIKLNLIDKLQTSDDFLLEKMSTHRCCSLKVHQKQPLIQKLLQPAQKLLSPFA